MFTIRKEQFAVFQQAASESFQDRMLSHIQQFFPQAFDQHGELGLRELVSYGVQRAATYNFQLEPDVCNYIDLMIVFGRDFDTNPAFPWASSILNDPALRVPSAKVEELHKAAAALGASAGGQ